MSSVPMAEDATSREVEHMRELLDKTLPHLTRDALSDALDGFQLPLVTEKDMDWLTMAVRRSLALTVHEPDEGPGRQSNTETRKELQLLSRRTSKISDALNKGLSPEARHFIFQHVSQSGEGNEWVEAGDGGGGYVWSAPLHLKYNDALASLDWLTKFLRRVAQDIPRQKPRWTQAELRETRAIRGRYLAPIFEAAYGLGALKKFSDFYQRTVSLAFKEEDIPDLEAIIAQVRKHHSEGPISTPEGWIPGI